ncbi:MAG: transglutaminase-like domain-containing protein [Chloroflexi bacterium]|nr:transglutaminase-like domain-containing protein [Chloroflexota bacterium]
MNADDAILELGKLVESAAADEVGGDIDLGLGALLIACTDSPNIDIDGVLLNLDRMASAASGRIPSDGNELQQLNAVTDLLFSVIGLAGNRDDYYDPRNSYLNHVLERRLGIPITLSLVCIEVGRRAGIPIVGIGMPGHFLIRHRDEPNFFVDCFNGGLLLSQDECGALMREAAGDAVRLEAYHLDPVTPREILARILRNLKAIYWDREEFDRCIIIIGALMAVLPDHPEEQRDRGVVHLKAGNHDQSAEDFAAYIEAAPDAEDIDTVRNALSRLRDSQSS